MTSETRPERVFTPEVTAGGMLMRFGDQSPFGSAELEFPGHGTLSFDPAAPERLLRLRVLDPDLAPVTLSRVLGADSAAALQAMSTTRRLHQVSAVNTDLGPLARLALARWLQRWSPTAIPSAAWSLDVGRCALQADYPLEAVRAFIQGAPLLVAVAERSLDRSMPTVVLRLLRETLETATASLGDGDRLSPRIRQLVDRYHDIDRADHERDWDEALAAMLDDQAAIHGDGTTAFLGLYPAEWDQLPPRLLAPHDGSLAAQHIDDELVVWGYPARWLDPAGTAGLRVRMLDAHTGRVLATAEMRWDRVAERFAARFPLDTSAAARNLLLTAVPDAYVEGVDRSVPRLRAPQEREETAVWRDAVRALAEFRRTSAGELAFGRPLPLRRVRTRVRRVVDHGERLGGDTARSAHAVRAWVETRTTPDASPEPVWPTGLVVASPAVGSPMLAELLEVTAPDLFESQGA